MITMIITLVILGVCLYLLETYVPMDPAIKTIIRVLVIIFSALWLLSFFGVVSTPPFMR